MSDQPDVGAETAAETDSVGHRLTTLMTDAGPAGAPQLLVGHDTHPSSKAALLLAADLAVRLGAHLHVAHVVELADIPVDPDSPEWNEAEDAKLTELTSDAKLLLTGSEVLWTYHACDGDPVDLLASVALDYEVLFIVVGTTEHNFYRRLTEGRAVSGRLLRGYHKPVLVVPEPAPSA